MLGSTGAPSIQGSTRLMPACDPKSLSLPNHLYPRGCGLRPNLKALEAIPMSISYQSTPRVYHHQRITIRLSGLWGFRASPAGSGHPGPFCIAAHHAFLLIGRWVHSCHQWPLGLCYRRPRGLSLFLVGCQVLSFPPRGHEHRLLASLVSRIKYPSPFILSLAQNIFPCLKNISCIT